MILWLYSGKPRPIGAVSGAVPDRLRQLPVSGEFTRKPDDGIFGLMTFGVSMGQWLSLPMVLAGIAMMLWAHRKPAP